MSGRSASTGADHRFACVNRVPLFADLTAEDRRRIADVSRERRGRAQELDDTLTPADGRPR